MAVMVTARSGTSLPPTGAEPFQPVAGKRCQLLCYAVKPKKVLFPETLQ